jgi:transposase
MTIEPEYVVLQLTTTAPAAGCLRCAALSSSVHSRYQRRLADLPWGTRPIRIQLTVRKFVCRNLICTRRIFAERVPALVAPYARKTRRLPAALRAIGVALGGQAGARLTHRLGLPASRDTLLRLVRRLPLPVIPPLRAIGVDDWAHRKRQRYGTILVDLERRQPVALLNDREADTLARWLRKHAGITIIARDRMKAYIDGARAGAPQAQTRAAQRRAQRLATYEHVWMLHRQGWSNRAIAQRLGIGRMTVVRSLQAPTFPERKGRSDIRKSLLTLYKARLLKRWNAGCREALRLFRDLQRHGYTGSYATVARYAQRLRQAQGLQPREQRPGHTLPLVMEGQHKPLTARRATRLVLKRPRQRTDEDTQLIVQLQAQHRDLAVVIELAQDFCTIVRERSRAPAAFCHRATRRLCCGQSRHHAELEERPRRRTHQPLEDAEVVAVDVWARQERPAEPAVPARGVIAMPIWRREVACR